MKPLTPLTKLQKFEAVTINRSEIKNAHYNPRKIGKVEKAKLKKSLTTHGLVETLVYNIRTGNLVGGHQRLEQLDLMENSKDYSLTVSQIDVDDKQEKEINIILNNQALQGDYDFDKLKLIMPQINYENAGFEEYEMSILGMDEAVEEQAETLKSKEEIEADIQAVKDLKQSVKDNALSKGDNYFVVMFGSYEEKESFLDSIGIPSEDRYVKGELFAKMLNLESEEVKTNKAIGIENE